MAVHWARSKFRMKLAAQKPRVILKFDNLNQFAVRRPAAQEHSFFREWLDVLIVEFIAVTMALEDFLTAVEFHG